MSTDISNYLSEILPYAIGVPHPTAIKAIRNAAIDFCERTKLWKYESTTAVLATDPATSSLITPTDSAVFDIEVALFNGFELMPKAPRDLDVTQRGWRTGDLGLGNPTYITQINQNTMTIVPQSSDDGSLYLCLRLKPSQTAATLPDFLIDYAECIGWGALGRVLSIPAQPYTNPSLATYYAARCNDKINTLSRKGTTGQQNAVKRNKSSFF